jgi:hypothetical protein
MMNPLKKDSAPVARVITMLAVLASMAALSLTLGSAASAAPYPIPVASPSITPLTPLAPNQPATLSLDGYLPNEIVTVSIGGAVLGVFPTDASGHATVPVTLPNLAAGTYSIAGVGNLGSVAQYVFTLGAGAVGAAPPRSGPLAFTGVAVAAGLVLAFALLVAGSIALVAGRGRRSAG